MIRSLLAALLPLTLASTAAAQDANLHLLDLAGLPSGTSWGVLHLPDPALVDYLPWGNDAPLPTNPGETVGGLEPSPFITDSAWARSLDRMYMCEPPAVARTAVLVHAPLLTATVAGAGPFVDVQQLPRRSTPDRAWLADDVLTARRALGRVIESQGGPRGTVVARMITDDVSYVMGLETGNGLVALLHEGAVIGLYGLPVVARDGRMEVGCAPVLLLAPGTRIGECGSEATCPIEWVEIMPYV